MSISLNYPVGSDKHVLSKITENNLKVETAVNANELEISIVNNDLTSQLAQIANFATLSPDKTGASDVTDKLKQLVAKAKAQGNSKIEIPTGTYLISDKTLIDFDNLEIDCNGSTFLWNNTTNIINDASIRQRDQGLFTINGTRQGYAVVPVSYIPKISMEELPNVANGTILNREGSTFYSKFELPSADISKFVLDDYVMVQSPHVGQTIDTFIPAIDIMCKIVFIEGNYIYLDYFSPFDFSSVLASDFKIDKVNPVKNVTIKNFTMRDITPYEFNTGNIEGDSPHWETSACGVGSRLATNIKVENVTGYGNKFPLVITQWAYNVTINNIVLHKPDYLGNGSGYAIHACGTMRIFIDGVTGEECNSVVDFSYCAFGELRNAKSSLNYSYKCFGTHGMCEHNILFVNCIGTFGFANGISAYTCAVADITLEHCECALINKDGYADNLNINNSVIYFTRSTNNLAAGYPRVTRATFTNTEIKHNNAALIEGVKRGLSIDTTVAFVNCKFTPLEPALNADGSNGFYIMNIDSATFDNCELDFSSFNQSIMLKNSSAKVTNCRLMDAYINYYADVAGRYFVKVDNNILRYTASYGLSYGLVRNLSIIANAIFDVISNDNTIINQSSKQIQILNPTQNSSGSGWTINSVMAGNIIDGGVSKFGVNLMQNNGAYVSDIVFDDNLVKNLVVTSNINSTKPVAKNFNYTTSNATGEAWTKIAEINTNNTGTINGIVLLNIVDNYTSLRYSGMINLNLNHSSMGSNIGGYITAKALYVNEAFDMATSLQLIVEETTTGVMRANLYLKLPSTNMRGIFSQLVQTGTLDLSLKSSQSLLTTLPTGTVKNVVVLT